MTEEEKKKKKKKKKTRNIIIAVVVSVAIVACGLCAAVRRRGDRVAITPSPTEAVQATEAPAATDTPAPTAESARIMYFCGYDRCRDSGEYGKLIFATGINVWNAPGPNRGGIHHTARNGEKASVVEEKRVDPGPGGLWYRLDGGGWTNDLWLTDEPCTRSNLDMHSFTDCLMGQY